MARKTGPERFATVAEQAFLDAAKAGDVNAMAVYLDSGGNINVGDSREVPWNVTALMHACHQHQKEAIKLLLSRGADWKLKDDAPREVGGGDTAFHYAAYAGNLWAVRVFLELGAKVDAKGSGGGSILCWALDREKGELARLALTAGAKPNQRDSVGHTPLMNAAQAGAVWAVRLLLERGADINAVEPTLGRTSLIFAVQCATEARSEIVATLLAKGADACHRPPSCDSALALCVRLHRVDVFQALVAAGADINQEVEPKHTLLDMALSYAEPASDESEARRAARSEYEVLVTMLKKLGAKRGADE